MTTPTKPLFWRDARMPHVELRKVEDGRKVCYAPHSHTQWSLGAITAGESTFRYRDDRHHVRAGTLVMMNPGWMHACSAIEDRPWGYLMLYVDAEWLTALRYQAGLLEAQHWQDIATAVIDENEWYMGYCRMAACLLDTNRDLLDKQTEVVEYLSALMHRLAGQPARPIARAPATLKALAAYLDEHASEDISLDDLCERSGYSAGHLIRAFKRHFGFTPHAYLVNRRIQLGQHALKNGTPIAEAALNAGFADQPHFQRTFKRMVAATPQQYRQSSLEQ
ncbi:MULTISPECIES: AraC family transcriptional regulator [Halomonadaceae]|jgi:AraC-like DNA-binding protein|uniref:AraC family transcriptional regulator n=1 Tax=Billgrantia aerodenitrificans TaxID=2733483 RepID=A0ABS9AYN4_9GAMM|nr:MULTISPECIES: AraC family transcriptional regulator [Halomonas]MCE8026515.1 AraC family transcriptional regulator [Halomonas aerodenitrificans]MCE8038551.1 AraC family transcriptional regulator [Halomonas sp. MCCC 1A11062]